jgi:hypothetical protein
MSIETTFNQDIKMTMTMNGRATAGAGRMLTMTNIMSQAITMKLDSVK